jgi:biopolymer transport protein ExbD
MIDMIFLLLIFFLVAAKWRPQEDFLPLQLLTAHAQDNRLVKPEPLIVRIQPTETGCEVHIGQFQIVQIENKKVDTGLAVLMEEMQKCLLAQKRFATDPVEIVCDGQVKWDNVAKIYNTFYGTGLTDITFRMTE